MEISGRKANLLLLALDKYLGVNEYGHLQSTDDHFSLPDAQTLRDRLFAAHQHAPEDYDPDRY